MLLNNQILIFEEFLSDFHIALTGSFIAKKKRLNQKTVANYLNRLEEEHILKSKMQGKNRLYSLNLDNREIVKNFIIAVEHLRTIYFYKKHFLIREVSEKMQPLIKGTAIIFGSYAKNIQNKDSDLDMLIIGRCREKEIEEISRLYKIEIGLKIYPKLKQDILIREVIKNHIIIKNAEHFVEAIIDG